MPRFSPTVDTFWFSPFLDGEVLFRDEDLTVIANSKLESDQRVMVLRAADGKVYAALTPELADKLEVNHQQVLTEPMLRQKMRLANVQLHGADHVFHFTEESKVTLQQEQLPVGVRQLSLDDAPAFALFKSAVSEQDLDDAYVELDHWAVFGAFEQGRLVCVASMYPWQGQKLADLGVLTLPTHRAMGHARRVVRAICRFAHGLGYESQYRCQTDNQASVSLARAAGFDLFGTWEVVSPDAIG